MEFAADHTALLFPGQGVSVAGSRDRVAHLLGELLERAVRQIGADPFEHAHEATRFAQPAIFLASLASLRSLALRTAPLAYAGHSLGELSALAASGALSAQDALDLVVLRGRLMDEAGRASGDGTMLAILRSTPEVAQELATQGGVWVANDNAPGQTVLAGGREALAEVARLARERGVRSLPLDVTGAFHSPWMAPATAPFRAALERVAFATPDAPVFSGLTAAPFTDLREQLAAALTGPVRWRETMLALGRAGAERYLDVGPEQVLGRLVSRNLPGAETVALEELDAVEA